MLLILGKGTSDEKQSAFHTAPGSDGHDRAPILCLLATTITADNRRIVEPK